MQEPSTRQREDQSVEIPLNNIGQSQRTDSHWRQVFDRYDHDNTGTLSLHELRAVIASREYRRDLPEWVAQRIMQLADRDNNGQLDYEEFLYMVNHPDVKHLFDHFLQKYVHFVVPARRPPDAVARLSSPDGQYEEEYSCWPPPVCMLLLSLVEIVLFAVDAASQHTQATGPAATALIYNPYKRHEAWRFLSYMFVHVGWMHITVNLLVQILLGLPLEMVHRWWRVLVIYGAGVVAGSLGTSITDPSVFLAGASGGVYALIAAHMSTIVLNWSQMEFAAIQLLVLIVVAGVDVGTAIYNRYVLDLEGNVGYVAHLAGALAGLLVGIGVLRNLEVKSWEKKLWWVAVVVYFLLMTVAIFLNIFWTSHFPATRYNYK